MKKRRCLQTAPLRHGEAAASTRAMPKDMASKRIHGSDAWCAVHQLPFASLSVGNQANARTDGTGRTAISVGGVSGLDTLAGSLLDHRGTRYSTTEG